MDGSALADPLFWAVAVPALLLVGIAKGGFGGGVGLIGVPLIAIAVPLVEAAAIMLPVLCVMDLFALWAYRHDWSRSQVRALLPAALAGVGLGALAFRALDEAAIRLLVGSIALLFAGRYWLGVWRRSGAEPSAAPPSPLWGWVWGAICGFTSTVAHAGGPPMSVYLLPQRLQPATYVGTTVVLFFAINYTKLLPYAWLGALDGSSLMASAALAPLAPVGIFLGRWLQRRTDEVRFYRVCYALLFAAGVRLFWDGLG